MMHRHLDRPSPVAGIWACARCGSPTRHPRNRATAQHPTLRHLVCAALAISLVAIVAAYAWTGIVFGVLWGWVHG